MGRSLLVAMVMVLSACGVSEAELSGLDDGTLAAETGDELSATSRTFVTVRHDTRKCLSPMCGGYYVADVNRVSVNEKYVSALDFSPAAAVLDEGSIAKVLEAADGEVVLLGKLGPLEPRFQTRTFLVSDAWRGLPGVKPAAGDVFYSATVLTVQCKAAPCPTLSAKKLNATATIPLQGLSVARATRPLVDTAWLAARVESHGALVAARVVRGTVYPAGPEQRLDASQVFVQLPERVGPCPQLPLHQCPAGQTHAGARTADRCVLYKACVTPMLCTQNVPVCAEGYTLISWAGGPGACTTYACDPTFVVP